MSNETGYEFPKEKMKHSEDWIDGFKTGYFMGICVCGVICLSLTLFFIWFPL